jgi:hypothetical protein
LWFGRYRANFHKSESQQLQFFKVPGIFIESCTEAHRVKQVQTRKLSLEVLVPK